MSMSRQGTSSLVGRSFSRAESRQDEEHEKELARLFTDSEDEVSEGDTADASDPSYVVSKSCPSRARSLPSGHGSKGKPRKRQAPKGSLSPMTTGNELDGEGEDDFSGVQVNHLLSKLGNQLQQRVRAKKQRMEEQFKAVKFAPNKLLASRARQGQQRQKLVLELQEETGKVSERLDNIIQLQGINEDKHTKMMISLSRGSEQVRVAISECVKAQTALYEKFVSDLKQLDERQDSGTQQMMERCENTLRELKSKLAVESMKSETESLMKMKFYA